MTGRLPFVLVGAALGAALRGWGSEPEATPMICFGNPADAVSSHGRKGQPFPDHRNPRQCRWDRPAGQFRAGRLAQFSRPMSRPIGRAYKHSPCSSTTARPTRSTWSFASTMNRAPTVIRTSSPAARGFVQVRPACSFCPCKAPGLCPWAYAPNLLPRPPGLTPRSE
jgi:hypothetical protein